MIPREAGRGQSFKGAGAYYLHDKEAFTSERVEFTHTENVPTNDPHKALKWMAWTAIHAEDLKREAGSKMTGRPCTKPVFTFSLSWHPEQEPKKWEMIGAGRRALIALGLQDHETVMVSHQDTDHKHLHIITSVIDPETGKANQVSFSKKRLSKWAEEYEREHGKIYCNKRVENNEKREQGEKVKYEEPELSLKSRITKLYQESDNGEAFQAALAEHGFRLAKGKKLVLIDSNGNAHSLSRQIDGAKEKQVRAKLADLELSDVDTVRKQALSPAQEQKPDPKDDEQNAEHTQSEEGDEYFDRDQQDQDWQESIIDAAILDEEKPSVPEKRPDVQPARPSTPPPPKGKPNPRNKLKELFPKPEVRRATPAELNHLQDRQLAELGEYYYQTTQARLALAQTLDRQYGEQERKLRDDIAQLDSVLTNSSRVRVWWLKLTKQIPKTAEEDLDGMRQTLQNIEWRQAEAKSAVEADAARCRKEIDERHGRGRLELRPMPSAEKTRSQLGESGREADGHELDLDGPSLDY
jgi:hypothetical protein